MLKQRASDKKESQIEQMSSEQIMNELKQKRLPTFGTANERKDRLKKFYGKYPANRTGRIIGYHSGFDTSKSQMVASNVRDGQSSNIVHQDAHNEPTEKVQKRSSCTDEIEKIKFNREERRRRMEDIKKNRE